MSWLQNVLVAFGMLSRLSQKSTAHKITNRYEEKIKIILICSRIGAQASEVQECLAYWNQSYTVILSLNRNIRYVHT